MNLRVKYIGGRPSYFRKMPEPQRPCACGQENKRRGQVVGPRCWAAAPKGLRKEVYSKDVEVARVAVRSLIDFARSRNKSTEANEGNKETGPESSFSSRPSVQTPTP